MTQHRVAAATLATSVGPLTDSVNRLNDTQRERVTMLAPVAGAERDVAHAGDAPDGYSVTDR